jgi:hypothetical protein
MNRTIDYFRRILMAEARDFQADLECMCEQQELRYRAGEISEHVYRENRAVFLNEVESINRFIALVEGLPLDDLAEIDDATAMIREAVKARLEGKLRCPCVLEQLDRKMDKVRAYVLA